MSEETLGRWIETCQCGRATRAKNLEWVVSGGKEPCDHPHPHDEDRVPSVVTEAGGCGCGDHDPVDAMMRAYLRSRVGFDFPRPQPDGVSEDATILLGYLADKLGWTEHGSSVHGDWLTEDGTLVLSRLDQRSDGLS